MNTNTSGLNGTLMRIALVMATLPAFFAHASAQDNIVRQTISWHSDRLQEKHSEQFITTDVDVAIFRNERIELRYPGQTLHFQIQSVEGDLKDITKEGSLVYSVIHDNASRGKVTINKHSDEITIEFDFTDGNINGLHQLFEIKRINVE
jgi:hypothetical protein